MQFNAATAPQRTPTPLHAELRSRVHGLMDKMERHADDRTAEGQRPGVFAIVHNTIDFMAGAARALHHGEGRVTDDHLALLATLETVELHSTEESWRTHCRSIETLLQGVVGSKIEHHIEAARPRLRHHRQGTTFEPQTKDSGPIIHLG